MTEGAVRHLTENPLEPGDWNPTAQAALERRTIHVLDVFAEPRYRPLVPSGTTNTRPNAGTVLAVPLMRYNELVGVISVWRYERKLFSEKQLAMVNTFAAQAVIAIGNVKLFNETKESLEQQTAISEILRVISASPSDVNPVLQAVAERAARICESPIVDIIVRDGDQLRSAASIGAIGRPESRLDRSTVMGRSIVDRAIVHVPDLQNAPEDEFPLGRKLAIEIGHRTTLAVPLLREDNVLGTILLRRREVRPFDDKHIALLKTFADQAAIAIENVRLFNETREALEQQTATAEVLNVISGSITDANPVFDAISRSVLKLCGARHVALFVRQNDMIDRVGYAVSDRSADDGSQALWPIPLDDKSLTGRAILGGNLVHIKDTETEPGLSEQSREIIRKTGVRSVLLAPMQSMGVATGTLSVARRAAGGFTEREVELLRTFADQAVIAMENVRLFREIQEKSAQLEVANKHKSDFLANMSHELRTPLNAIIGFSEVLIERMFGEVNEKQADYLKDIHESGKHLLSLINDILDLSKIEAGRMDLEISTFDLPSALSNAMTLVRERAQRHGIALGLDVDPRLGEFRADERKFKQIVVNLLSNAVKFTPDGGRVDVNARLDTDKVEIAVKDTGIGIAPEDHAAVFEEFKQVGRDYTRKAEGTGLGLALTKRFVELHGGGIRLESAPGKGSTFTITLPLTH
jgi:signal transduction histidine kinase